MKKVRNNAKLYHPYDYEDFKKFAPALPLDDFFQAILGQVPDKVIVDEERFLASSRPIL